MDRGAWWATYSPWHYRELDTTDELNTAITSTKNIEEGMRVKIMSPTLPRLFEVSTQVGDCWKYMSKA